MVFYMSISLSACAPGTVAYIEALHIPGGVAARLRTMGFCKMQRISVLHRKGDGSVVVELMNSRMALSSKIAKNIDVALA